MGRAPCCDKIGVKKGPWTPEEDIILVSYIQEHGPGNWKSVPTNTGLLRCSKSCRLRWTNYLRPGIKRGNFTDHEEKMVVHLQALLGNRWAAIASYLPERTDNDIKNYWNTHLKKKLKRLQYGKIQNHDSFPSQQRGQWEMRLQTDIKLAKQDLHDALSLNINNSSTTLLEDSIAHMRMPTTTAYASSAENIARLLENWKTSSPKKLRPSVQADSDMTQASMVTPNSSSSEGFDSLISFNSSNSDDESKPINMGNSSNQQIPLELLEKWLFDEGVRPGQEDLFNMVLDDI